MQESVTSQNCLQPGDCWFGGLCPGSGAAVEITETSRILSIKPSRKAHEQEENDGSIIYARCYVYARLGTLHR